MTKLESILQEYAADTKAVQSFCDDIYNQMFAENFANVREIYSRMKSNVHPITDDELEYVLTTFPMELFTISENLTKLRLDCAVVKLKNKDKSDEVRSQLEAAVNSDTFEPMSKSNKQDYILRTLNHEMTEYNILLAAYNSLITRVESEQSFARELIMGAKKVWDARRAGESANPVSPTASELPEYDRQQYIR